MNRKGSHGPWCPSKIVGNWNWLHDGSNVNGDLTLNSDFSVSHKNGWKGIMWKALSAQEYEIIFNDVKHKMIFDGKTTLTLSEPARNPKSIAQKIN